MHEVSKLSKCQHSDFRADTATFSRVFRFAKRALPQAVISTMTKFDMPTMLYSYRINEVRLAMRRAVSAASAFTHIMRGALCT